MNEDTLKQLAAYLTDICEVQNVAGHQAECDGDFSHTQQWLREKGYSEEGMEDAMQWLKGRGIGCDCEVLWSGIGAPGSEDQPGD
jgi:hypothetical protein